MNYVLEHDRFGGGIMVLAGIHQDGRTALLRVNEVLRSTGMRCCSINLSH